MGECNLTGHGAKGEDVVTGRFSANQTGITISTPFAPSIVFVMKSDANTSASRALEYTAVTIKGIEGQMFHITPSGFYFDPGIIGWAGSEYYDFCYVAYK